ncbi:MAG: GGDEF domain-containing protein [Microthrixaceae bacterium]|nr:GGDEF domain-containing protein [Microthrixaceae bacterium]
MLSETGETLFGALELAAPRPEGPAPLDVHLLARVASLASIAFARHRDDRLLIEAANTDYLTGLANRRHFESRLAEQAIAIDALPLALLYVDVDDFKAVNDNYGHHAGDQVLAAVAARLSHVVRPGDFVGAPRWRRVRRGRPGARRAPGCRLRGAGEGRRRKTDLGERCDRRRDGQHRRGRCGRRGLPGDDPRTR